MQTLASLQKLSAFLIAILFMVGGVLLLTPQSQAQRDVDYNDHRATQIKLVGILNDLRQGAPFDASYITRLGQHGDPLYIAPLLDIGYFLRGTNQANITVLRTVETLANEEFTTWTQAFEWAGRTDIALPPYYDEFKGLLFATIIDPEFARFFAPGVQETARVNLIEAVWGGVTVDGIPSLVNARQITPEEATAEGQDLTQFCRDDDCSYPAPDELVFGVYLNGDARAYPLRLLNWHEMFNDIIGHTPLLNAPDGDFLCNFRAPTRFDAIARAGDAWVQIDGVSAGCPESGWVSAEAIEWIDTTWQRAQDFLPDVNNGEEALDDSDGVSGRIQGQPVMLAYCTLCGSGILYDVTIPELSYVDGDGETVNMGETVLEFGSTGMLMRSNKLMYDRNTDTVWNAITGVPAFGPLATSDIVLDLLPVVVTDWQTWLQEHPESSVLSLRTGYRRDYTNGAAYDDYFNDPDFVMFPVWQQNEAENANKEMVFGLTVGDVKKAYPLEDIIAEGVTNDSVNGLNVTLITRATPDRDFFEPGGAAVRAYERGDYVFSQGENAQEVMDQDGNIWQVTEDALINADGEQLARLPGHLAFWFGWYSFNPDTLVYSAS